MTDVPAQINDAPNSKKTPSHYVYQSIKTKDPQPFFRRIGSAWIHSDGKGFNVQLESFPLDGRVQLRVPTERTA